MNIPDTEKKIKQRISSYKSAMNKEKKQRHFISDGAGKRYVLFCLYYLLNDDEKAEDYISWYEAEFPDDCGEPNQYLCWALMLHRMGKAEKAKVILANLLLTNLYFIPRLLGEDVEEYDIWHSSSDGRIDCFDYLPEEILSKITTDEKIWIQTLYESFDFRRIRKRYIEIFNSLNHIKNPDERGVLLKESYQLLGTLSNVVPHQEPNIE